MSLNCMLKNVHACCAVVHPQLLCFRVNRCSLGSLAFIILNATCEHAKGTDSSEMMNIPAGLRIIGARMMIIRVRMMTIWAGLRITSASPRIIWANLWAISEFLATPWQIYNKSSTFGTSKLSCSAVQASLKDAFRWDAKLNYSDLKTLGTFEIQTYKLNSRFTSLHFLVTKYVNRQIWKYLIFSWRKSKTGNSNFFDKPFVSFSITL